MYHEKNLTEQAITCSHYQICKNIEIVVSIMHHVMAAQCLTTIRKSLPVDVVLLLDSQR